VLEAEAIDTTLPLAGPDPPAPPRALARVAGPTPAVKAATRSPDRVVRTPVWAIVYFVFALVITLLGVAILHQQATLLGHY